MLTEGAEPEILQSFQFQINKTTGIQQLQKKVQGNIFTAHRIQNDRHCTDYILFQAALTKSIFNIIQKADHKIWRKTGKDSVIANKIWWVQQKWMGLEKGQRRKIMIVAFVVFMIWYSYRIIT